MSMFQTSVGNVEKEAKFYRESEAVMKDIDEFRARLNAQNEEFNLLLEYYVKHRGKIDVHHKNRCGPLAAKPNLGTDDESWYYLDAAGNKIWVRSLELDTADPKCGAFANHKRSDGRVVVVTVPKAKKNYALQPDYRKKCDEYDAFARNMGAHRLGANASPQRGGQVLQASSQDAPPNRVPGTNVEQYIAAQQDFQHALQKSMVDRATKVMRPPATIEEAEMRLAELRAEESRIRDAFAVERDSK